MRTRKRFVYAERVELEDLLRKGYSVCGAAIKMKRTTQSIMRELLKGGGAKLYTAQRAHLTACSMKMGLAPEDLQLKLNLHEGGTPVAATAAPAAPEPDSTLEDKMAELTMQVEIAFDMIKELQNKLNKQEILV